MAQASGPRPTLPALLEKAGKRDRERRGSWLLLFLRNHVQAHLGLCASRDGDRLNIGGVRTEIRRIGKIKRAAVLERDGLIGSGRNVLAHEVASAVAPQA